MSIIDKLIDTLNFLRYGPTQARGLQQQLRDAQQQLQEQLRVMQAATQADRDRQSAHEAASQKLQALIVEAHEKIVAVGQQLERAQQQAAIAEAANANSMRDLGESLRRDLDSVRSQLSGLATALDRAVAAPDGATRAVPSSVAALEEGFYPMLEKHFRGSQDDVKRRLSSYRESVDAMPNGPVADLGCGRGEWLELLASWGREAIGVDSNALFVADLRGRNLRVEEGDATQWLQRQPEASLAGVTVFHVVEHLPFGAMLRLMMESHRVLKPGGILIVETPNPENLEVATQTFWLDPTHQRPLPAELVELATRYCGFAQSKVLRLNPPEGGNAPGRDYALIASKAAAQ
jgi:O-antigen chain-terminating methyltransferase